MGSSPSTAGGGKGDIEFYYDHRSPPSRCVQMTLTELGVKFTPKKLDLFKGEHKKPDYLKINPAGKVPAIKIGNFTMSESRAIACFLCNKYNTAAAKRLYPRAPQDRAEVDRLLLISDDVMNTINKQINFFAVMFGGQRPNRDALPEAAKVNEMVAEYLGDNKFLAGNNLTLADFFVSTPFWLYEISTTDEEREEFFDSKGGDKVKAWLQRIRDLPYFSEINDAGLEAVGQIYKSKI